MDALFCVNCDNMLVTKIKMAEPPKEDEEAGGGGAPGTEKSTGSTLIRHCRNCNYTIEEGRAACKALLNAKQPPTAILCSNDVLATGALLECQARGVEVPAKVSIAGFDNLPISANLTPSLTTVDIPFKAMGQRAAQYLIDCLAGDSPGPQTEIRVDLLVRNSTAKPWSP